MTQFLTTAIAATALGFVIVSIAVASGVFAASLVADTGETVAQYATAGECEDARLELGHTADDYRCE